MSSPATTETGPRPIHDTWIVAKRGLKHIRRQPEALMDATLQPVMFVVLFAFVFGGAIAIPGAERDPDAYREFLIGGIFAQTLTFAVFGVGMSLAADRANGATDRFRSLPISRSAVLGGHAIASLFRGIIPIVFMSVTGLLIGWTIRSSFLDAVAGYALMMLFTFAMIWIGVLLGSVLKTPEAVQGFSFVAIFPVTFVASTFVPTQTMPGVLRTVAEWNPVSALATSLRTLFGNVGGSATAPGTQAWPVEHATLYAVLCSIAIIVIAAPIAIRAYQRSITD